uniref:Uncharacterized protein n=1 Tax=Arundo donax TaxID=35708 RepID=A0A0A9C725_ARUDO
MPAVGSPRHSCPRVVHFCTGKTEAAKSCANLLARPCFGVARRGVNQTHTQIGGGGSGLLCHTLIFLPCHVD